MAALGLGLGLPFVMTHGGGFSPDSLFANGEQGVWYDPSDLSTLFQDSAGTVPVTASGQPVGMMRDKSGRGNHATQGTAASRPIYTEAGALRFLAFDGADDSLSSSGGGTLGTVMVAAVGLQSNGAGGNGDVWGSKVGNGGYRMLANAIGGETFLVGNGAAFSGGAVNLPADTNGVLAGTYDGATAIARLNGAAGTSSAVSVSGGGAASALGKAQDFAGSFFNGRIYQVIVRAGATSALELAGIEAYVASKSGVTL